MSSSVKKLKNEYNLGNMIIIVGLGNPGNKFKYTRHNAGFMTVDFFAEKNNFPEFMLQKKYNALISKTQSAVLMKPQTFMNDSGFSVKKLIKHSNQSSENLVVVHDDIDLPVGKIKIAKESGSGGHKGVESIIQHLGTKDFIRIKIGICPEKGKPINVEAFVIKSFTKKEKEIINVSVTNAVEALNFLIENGLEKTMNEYNR